MCLSDIFKLCMVALIATTLMTLLNALLMYCALEWGLINWFEARKPKWLKWLKHCYFCFGFRLALIECVLLSIILGSAWFLVIAFFATPITHLLFKRLIS